MENRDFNVWLGKMHKSINGYDYYTDFNKVYQQEKKINVELNIMNSLIGSKNIEEEFKEILKKYPNVLRCIPILLAVREHKILIQDGEQSTRYDFKNRSLPIEQYLYFMKKTGLLDLISNHLINNLVDYVLGVETGLDSNGRKNRGGHQMENLVERFIKKTGICYYKEMYLSEVEKKWHVDLSNISANGTSTKRWDFVVKNDSTIFLIETNFYASNGSKLNETARSYKMIAEEVSEIDNVEFVWITDGGGWKSARKNLKETFDTMKHLYNISELRDGIFTKIFLK